MTAEEAPGLVSRCVIDNSAPPVMSDWSGQSVEVSPGSPAHVMAPRGRARPGCEDGQSVLVVPDEKFISVTRSAKRCLSHMFEI